MDELVSGEAVVIEVPCARFPSRMLAITIDILIQGLLLTGLAVLIAATAGNLDAAAMAATTLTVFVAVIVGYPTLFETLSRGRSVGKLALGLQVVGDDGGAERFRQALIRALAAVVEIWLLFGAPALITSLLSAKGKRLGDLFAGTFVIQQRLPARPARQAQMPPHLAAWAATAELSALPDSVARAAASYLSRFWELAPQARQDLGLRIAAEVAAQTSPPPPPGTTACDFLSAVIAERRSRAVARAGAGPSDGGASVG